MYFGYTGEVRETMTGMNIKFLKKEVKVNKLPVHEINERKPQIK